MRSVRLFLLFTLAAFVFATTGCNPRESAEAGAKASADSSQVTGKGETESLPVTEVNFETTEHNFGKINDKDKVSFTYKFKNVGKNPLKITNIKTSCGCTSKNYSKDLVPAGSEGFVTLEFDPSGKKGEVSKSATVFANTAERIVLKFKAEIEASAAAAN
jgi:hypothetical protein